MRFPLVMLALVTFGGSACASKYHWPHAVYWVELREPRPIELATGAKIPCGRGMAMAVEDRLLGCISDRRATIQRRDFPAGTSLCFRWDGTLERAGHIERRGHLADGQDFLDARLTSFDQRGQVTSSTVDQWQGSSAKPLEGDATPWCLGVPIRWVKGRSPLPAFPANEVPCRVTESEPRREHRSAHG